METEICKSKVKADIAANSRKIKSIDLSVAEKLAKTYANTADALESSMKSELTPSFNGKSLVVSYVVRLAIRHSSWNAGQKGKIVELPVWISHPPIELMQQMLFVPSRPQQQLSPPV